jgi:hypothetical protein
MLLRFYSSLPSSQIARFCDLIIFNQGKCYITFVKLLVSLHDVMILVVMLQFMTLLVRVHDPSGLSLLVGVVIVLLILSCLATRKRRQERKYVLYYNSLLKGQKLQSLFYNRFTWMNVYLLKKNVCVYF